jgi:hypothetical protein
MLRDRLSDRLNDRLSDRLTDRLTDKLLLISSDLVNKISTESVLLFLLILSLL